MCLITSCLVLHTQQYLNHFSAFLVQVFFTVPFPGSTYLLHYPAAPFHHKEQTRNIQYFQVWEACDSHPPCHVTLLVLGDWPSTFTCALVRENWSLHRKAEYVLLGMGGGQKRSMLLFPAWQGRHVLHHGNLTFFLPGAFVATQRLKFKSVYVWLHRHMRGLNI